MQYRVHITTTRKDEPPIVTLPINIPEADLTALEAEAYKNGGTVLEELGERVLDSVGTEARNGALFLKAGRCEGLTGFVAVNIGCIETIAVELVEEC